MKPNDNIKNLIKMIGDAMSLISDIKSGFSLSQIPKLISIGNKISSIAKEAQDALQEFEKLDEESRQDLFKFINEEISFPSNQKVEDIAEKMLRLAVSLSESYQAYQG